MAWEAWFVIAVVLAMLVALAKEVAPPDLLVLIALLAVVVVGELERAQAPVLPAGVKAPALKLPTATQAIAEFGNVGIVTVGALFVVVAGLVQTGATGMLTEPLLGRPKSLLSAQ